MTALIISTGGARALPLDLLLSSIPSLPRHVLDRLVERAIDHMDELDAATEDMEDDDPAGGAVDDQGEGATFEEWNGQRGLIAYADDEQEEDLDDRRARQPHAQRIEHTRCDRIIDSHGYGCVRGGRSSDYPQASAPSAKPRS